jgi:hypothetical protein
VLRATCNSDLNYSAHETLQSCYREGFGALLEGKSVEEVIYQACTRSASRTASKLKCIKAGVSQASVFYKELEEIFSCENRKFARVLDKIKGFVGGKTCYEDKLLNFISARKAHLAIHTLNAGPQNPERTVVISGQQVKAEDQRQAYEYGQSRQEAARTPRVVEAR